MGRSQETFNKKEVRNKKEKKRKDKEAKKLERNEREKNSFDDMIAYVDEFGRITSTPPDPSMKQEIKLEDISMGANNRNTGDEVIEKKSGVLTFFNKSKGYGFIKIESRKDSLFVHINNMTGEMMEGDVVEFDEERGPKGNIAVNVKKKTS